jgi:hypothetical protein
MGRLGPFLRSYPGVQFIFLRCCTGLYNRAPTAQSRPYSTITPLQHNHAPTAQSRPYSTITPLQQHKKMNCTRYPGAPLDLCGLKEVYFLPEATGITVFSRSARGY